MDNTPTQEQVTEQQQEAEQEQQEQQQQESEQQEQTPTEQEPEINVTEIFESIKPEDASQTSQVASSIEILLGKAAAGDESIAKGIKSKVGLLSIKNPDGISILDHVAKTEAGIKLIKDVILQPLILSENEGVLKELAACGWSDFSLSPETEMTEGAKTLLAILTDIRIKSTVIQAAIRDGRLDDVKSALQEDSDTLKTAGISGLLPIHQAVVYNHKDIVQFIASSFADTVNLRDNMGRSALHYAAGCGDEGNMYQVLKDAGADETLVDKLGIAPNQYLENPEEYKLPDAKMTLERLMKGEEKASSRSGSRPTSANEAGAKETECVPEPEKAQEDEQKQRTPTPPKPETPPGPKKVKPVAMYLSKGGENQTNAPPPTTVDGKYIAQNLGTALTLALAEIAEKRLWDPIEYLAFWLQDYHKNEAYAKQQADMIKNIKDAEAKQNEIEELKFKRKEELMRLREDEMRKKKEEEEEKRRQELEEMQRSNKEANLAQKPQLPTVKEDEEPETTTDDDPNVKDRDTDGLTEMHKLASQEGIDLKSLIDLGYSIADRDIKGRTARDIAQEAGRKDTVLAIDNHVKQLLSDGIIPTLEKLVLEGYDEIEQLADDNIPEATRKFLQNIDILKDQMNSGIKLAESGKAEEFKEALEALPQLIQSKDQSGQSLLHHAVTSDNTPVVDFLLTQHPNLIHSRDNKNRTALHYAYNKSEELANLLITKGARQNAMDVHKKTPVYYKDHPVDQSTGNPPTVLEPDAPTEQPVTDADDSDKSMETPAEPAIDPSQLATTSVTADPEQQTS